MRRLRRHRTQRLRQQGPIGEQVPGRLSARAGHRSPGRTPGAPENTLASLQAAARHGADVVGADVQFTRDGTPVLMHDETVDRMTLTGRRIHAAWESLGWLSRPRAAGVLGC
ncbi:glycerophosphodiester phosphodiesterase family protein [Streptomyces candidus]|uniref:glycerophosphodiester phosphodiesterase family protein n=1 Tax=Streptomyces candidus TaxID=67283 RepID=UPI002892C1D5|nr:glycerophosphodiester phosphodiesterase family protein [Streptomyces candidus]